MNYAIIGCGLIGKKRLAGLPRRFQTRRRVRHKFVARRRVGETRADRPRSRRFQQAVADPQVDAVIVATINSALAEVSAAAIRAGKHVLVEKPAGISVRAD